MSLYSVDIYGVADHNLFGVVSMATSPSSAESKINMIDIIIALTNNVWLSNKR